MPRQRVGSSRLTKIVPVKIDSMNFYKLRQAQLQAKQLIEEGLRKQEHYEELATILRGELHDYIQKLELFNRNGESMKNGV